MPLGGPTPPLHKITTITTFADLRRSEDRGPCHFDRKGEISRRWRSIEMTSSRHLHWANTPVCTYGSERISLRKYVARPSLLKRGSYTYPRFSINKSNLFVAVRTVFYAFAVCCCVYVFLYINRYINH